MRWDDLFDDLAGQLVSAGRGAAAADARELATHERAVTSWLGRLVGRTGSAVELDLVDGTSVHGCTAGVGDGWASVGVGPDEVLVPAHAIARVRAAPGDDRRSPSTQAGLTLRVVLRGLARSRTYVRVTSSGGWSGGGTVRAVGADHLELAEHPDDVLRTRAVLRPCTVLPLDAVLQVRYLSGAGAA